MLAGKVDQNRSMCSVGEETQKDEEKVRETQLTKMNLDHRNLCYKAKNKRKASTTLSRMKNLYVCGASVFPSSGYANPTLTAMALASRLAKTLSVELCAAARV